MPTYSSLRTSPRRSVDHCDRPLRVLSTNALSALCRIHYWSGETPSQRTYVGVIGQSSAKDVCAASSDPGDMLDTRLRTALRPEMSKCAASARHVADTVVADVRAGNLLFCLYCAVATRGGVDASMTTGGAFAGMCILNPQVTSGAGPVGRAKSVARRYRLSLA